MEGAGVCIAAFLGHLRHGILRVAQQAAGLVDAKGVDVLAEVDAQLLRKDVRQVDAAHAQRLRGAFQRDILGKMLGYIMKHPVAQPAFHVAARALKRKRGQHMRQKHMQVGCCQPLILARLRQLADGPHQLFVFCIQPAERVGRKRRAEYPRELADGLRQEDQRKPLRVGRHLVIAVRDDRKDHRRFARTQRAAEAVHRHANGSVGDVHHLHRVVHMGGKRMVADKTGKQVFSALFVKQSAHGLMSSLRERHFLHCTLKNVPSKDEKDIFVPLYVEKGIVRMFHKAYNIL